MVMIKKNSNYPGIIQEYGRSYVMAEEGKTYVCLLCGQEVKVSKSGAGTLVCCDQPMEKKDD